MFDWIKFFPFIARYDYKQTEIRGPYFEKPKQCVWHFGDCRFSFKAPKSNSVFGFSNKGMRVEREHPKRNLNLLQAMGSVPNGGDWDNPKTRWSYRQFYLDEWFFVGPWFTGIQACFSARASIILVSPLSSFYGKNFFHPNVFETAVGSILDCRYGHHEFNTKKKAHFRGPLNWKVLPISESVKAISCDIHGIGNGTVDDPELYRHVYFPISKDKIVYINFDFGGVAMYHDMVRAKPLFNLCNSIIDSMHLEVGPATLAEWDKVKATCPDMSITETFGELQWPLAPEKPTKKKREFDITPASSVLKRIG